jgi:hypothetical protein
LVNEQVVYARNTTLANSKEFTGGIVFGLRGKKELDQTSGRAAMTKGKMRRDKMEMLYCASIAIE